VDRRTTEVGVQAVEVLCWARCVGDASLLLLAILGGSKSIGPLLHPGPGLLMSLVLDSSTTVAPLQVT
jgi:hypothetical protein